MFQPTAPRKNRTDSRRRPQVEACEGRLLLSSLVTPAGTGQHVETPVAISPTPTADVVLIKHGW